jgi:dTDP-glucose 4,6-dehydratase
MRSILAAGRVSRLIDDLHTKVGEQLDTELKTMLVTGGAGFIGSNFIRFVLGVRPSVRIINLDALTYAGNPHNLDGLDDNVVQRYQFVHGDIRDDGLLKSLFAQNNIIGVIHFAAESHVDRSIIGPEAFVETNVLGTFQLLEATRLAWESKKHPNDIRFHHVSTDEVYGSLGDSGQFHEDTPYDPSSPYSASKAASDHFVNAYHRTYGLPTLITNCSNNYGPYQFPEKLIPLMIMNIIEEKPLPIYGDGQNVRDWLYVIDHCEGLLEVFEKGIPGETYNIGGYSEKQNIQVVHMLCDIMDDRLRRPKAESSRQLIQFVTDRPGHDRRYAINLDKISQTIGWQPRHQFEEALEKTVDWYLSHMDWVDSVRSGDYRRWIDQNYGDR